MNKLYIRNATDINGKAVDCSLGRSGSEVTTAPAGSLAIPQGATRIIDAHGKILLPALFDLHATIEIPGRSKRESVSRAGQAALNGGVWGMLVMPSEGFMFDNYATLDSFRDAVSQRSATEMYAAGCISLGMKGQQQAPYNTMAARGVSILTDAGRMPVSLLMLYRAMKYAGELGLTFAIRGDVPELTQNTCINVGATSYRLGLHGTPPCAEEIGIETVLRLAADAGARVHIQTVSTAEGVAIIRRAKAQGVKVTAEVALHHLLYTDEDIGDYDTNFKTLPPLRSRGDVDALLAGVKDGTIDCIVSDHSPCTPFAKKQDFISAPQGMVSLDTFLPAIYTHLILPGKLSWADVVRTCSENPCRIANPQDPEMDTELTPPLMLFDAEARVTVSESQLSCGTLNTPLLGSTLCGAVTLPLQ